MYTVKVGICLTAVLDACIPVGCFLALRSASYQCDPWEAIHDGSNTCIPVTQVEDGGGFPGSKH